MQISSLSRADKMRSMKAELGCVRVSNDKFKKISLHLPFHPASGVWLYVFYLLLPNLKVNTRDTPFMPLLALLSRGARI